ncbi:hypothetical protein BS17DRAFT_736100 [Gyrodon lividus]|nr:hypothetical protein BS17DRAFT_736100 [Gyrodon lividus]
MSQDQPDDDLLSSIRETCFCVAETYVHNDLPTYLIRLSDMKLLSRNDILEDVRPLIQSQKIDLEEVRKGVTKDKIGSYCKDYVRRLLDYAIFSHRWGIGEPAFYEMSTKRYGEKPKPTGPGFKKLLEFCKKARDDYGCAYAWSDTCCINKESSAELEEAIRSMYRWYERAQICVVHLAKSSSIEDFARDPWFTRGWTLQELLAPRRLRFFGKDWRPICPEGKEESGDVDVEGYTSVFHYPNDKRSDFMLNAVRKVTDIDIDRLRTFRRRFTSISETMSWASKRETTRVEDVAYSLLGILDISMPIAYGEGRRAFHRLMEAIAQSSNDTMLFAWAGSPSPYSYALPSSPACYGRCNPYSGTNFNLSSCGDPFYTVTKTGLQVKLLIVPVKSDCDDPFNKLIPIHRAISAQPVTYKGSPSLTAESYVLGIVNYFTIGVDIDTNHGTLFAGGRYFGVLIRRQRSVKGRSLVGWKLPTHDIPTIHCTEEFMGELETVCLLHNPYL